MRQRERADNWRFGLQTGRQKIDAIEFRQGVAVQAEFEHVARSEYQLVLVAAEDGDLFVRARESRDQIGVQTAEHGRLAVVETRALAQFPDL